MMNKFQKLNFGSVEEFLVHLPQEELEVVTRLREIIDDTFPRYREKLAYNVPFYYHRKRICFIWPSTIPWGNLSKGVALGFIKAREIDPNQHFLDYDQRKSMGRMVIQNLGDMNEKKTTNIKLLLQEAYLLDSKS